MDLVFFGIQGSGKGTQARKLAEGFGYKLFETGAALREIAKTDSDLGRTVKSTIDAGHHLSADIVMDVLRTAVLAHRKETQMIFDGMKSQSCCGIDKQPAADKRLPNDTQIADEDRRIISNPRNQPAGRTLSKRSVERTPVTASTTTTSNLALNCVSVVALGA